MMMVMIRMIMTTQLFWRLSKHRRGHAQSCHAVRKALMAKPTAAAKTAIRAMRDNRPLALPVKGPWRASPRYRTSSTTEPGRSVEPSLPPTFTTDATTGLYCTA